MLLRLKVRMEQLVRGLGGASPECGWPYRGMQHDKPPPHRHRDMQSKQRFPPVPAARLQHN